ncbi:hypothetical protein [Streptomyces sp. NPDC015350]|uniref:hypothetical protein n=1 Tax=Streptomyces sp. NPDC015350 TaxID=3364955 RepID=UPI003701AA74
MAGGAQSGRTARPRARGRAEADRRRRIIGIAPDQEPAITAWLAPGAAAWREALTPLTSDQRQLFVDTLLAYEAAVGDVEQD